MKLSRSIVRLCLLSFFSSGGGLFGGVQTALAQSSSSASGDGGEEAAADEPGADDGENGPAPEQPTKEQYVQARVQHALSKYPQAFSGSLPEEDASSNNHGVRRRMPPTGPNTVVASSLGTTRCLQNFTFTTFNGCTNQGGEDFIEALEQKLILVNCSSFGVWNELKAVTGWNDTVFWTNFYGWFWDECYTDFWNKQQKFKLWELFDGADIKVKAFFDGGTLWNDVKQTSVTNGWDTKYRLDTMMFPVDHFDFGPMRRGVVELPHSHVVQNFRSYTNYWQSCETNTIYCCWVQDIQAGDGNGNCNTPYDWTGCNDADPADNTDICYVNMTRAPMSARVPDGFALYPGNTEGDAHCHGLSWTNEFLDFRTLLRGNTLTFVALADHLRDRGYAKEVPGSPMCGCAEQMAVVSRSDCSEPVLRSRVTWSYDDNGLKVTKDPDFEVDFQACQGLGANNDLDAFVKKLVMEWDLTPDQQKKFEKAVVGDCDLPTKRFLHAKILEHDLDWQPPTPTFTYVAAAAAASVDVGQVSSVSAASASSATYVAQAQTANVNVAAANTAASKNAEIENTKKEEEATKTPGTVPTTSTTTTTTTTTTTASSSSSSSSNNNRVQGIGGITSTNSKNVQILNNGGV